MLRKLFAASAAVAGFFTGVALLDYKHLEVTRTKINIPCDSESKSLRIVHISDLHDFEYGSGNSDLFSKVKAAKPDVICISGDLINSRMKAFDNVLLLLEKLMSLNIPVLYGYGNHEENFRDCFEDEFYDYIRRVKELGVTVLNDDYYEYGDIVFAGYTNKLYQFGKFKGVYDLQYDEIAHEFTLPPELTDRKIILLAHNPMYFDLYREWGAHLVLSGHLHGGIIRLPGIGGIISPQKIFSTAYSAGLYKEDNRYMYVSRGLGVHTIPVRIFNRPELAVLDVDFIKEE